MITLNKKIYVNIDGSLKEIAGIDQVDNGEFVNITSTDVNIGGVLKEIADLLVYYTWKKYNVVETINREIYAPGVDDTLENLESDIDTNDVEPEHDCDETLEPNATSGTYSSDWSGFDTIEISNGEIVGSNESSVHSANYLRWDAGGHSYTWYYVGSGESNGTLYLFELSVETNTTYSQGTYIEDVISTNASEYPNPPYNDPEDYIQTDSDGNKFWYVRQ